MAEGPSIVILKEKAGVFVGDNILRVEGNMPIAKERLFTFEFHEWKKADMNGDKSVWQGDTLAKHWLVHNKKSARAATFH